MTIGDLKAMLRALAKNQDALARLAPMLEPGLSSLCMQLSNNADELTSLDGLLANVDSKISLKAYCAESIKADAQYGKAKPSESKTSTPTKPKEKRQQPTVDDAYNTFHQIEVELPMLTIPEIRFRLKDMEKYSASVLKDLLRKLKRTTDGTKPELLTRLRSILENRRTSLTQVDLISK